jgi:glycosyltransferase involved in cell wall biosynthesis
VSASKESVSVVLATFNGERYLREQLESLTAQVHMPAEVLIGDDGSTDSTVQIIERFITRSTFPVRLVRRKRLGYADNFLTTAQMATGSLVAFCDQDDIWHADKLTRIVEVFNNSPDIVLVAHHADVIGSDGAALGRTFPRPSRAGRYAQGSLPLAHYPGFAITVRRMVLDATDPDRRPDEKDERAGLMGHDPWTWMLAACLGDSVILEDRLVSYRQHDNLFGDLHVSVRERLRRAWATTSASYEKRAAQEMTKAEYLEGLAREWTHGTHVDWATVAQSRGADHRLLAVSASQRAQLYRSPSRIAAGRRLASMVRSGAYTSPEGNIAWRSIVKDGALLPIGYKKASPMTDATR